jgi:predicted DCC family thiol-disulfide oxidoreductase YuxK
MSGTLYFDGGCGMCTRARDFLVRLDRTGELETAPFQGPGVAALLGVSEERMHQSVWWVDSAGAVCGGAAACNAALSAALGSRLPLLLYRVPGVRTVEEVAYRWVATHRHGFPGTTPYCEAHPVAC